MTSLLLLLAGLSGLLIFLVYIYVRLAKNKNDTAPQSTHILSFNEIQSIITDKHSSKVQIKEAVETLIRDYSHVNHDRPVGDYIIMLETLCVHPHTDSKFILELDKALRRSNSQYQDQIGQALKRGLEARG